MKYYLFAALIAIGLGYLFHVIDKHVTERQDRFRKNLYPGKKCSFFHDSKDGREYGWVKEVKRGIVAVSPENNPQEDPVLVSIQNIYPA